MSIFKKKTPTLDTLKQQGKVMEAEEPTPQEQTPIPPKPTAEGFKAPEFPGNEYETKEPVKNVEEPESIAEQPTQEITAEYIAELVKQNYYVLQEAYLNLINRLDLMETRLRTDQDTINDTWKIMHEIKTQLIEQKDDKEEPEKTKKSKEKK